MTADPYRIDTSDFPAGLYNLALRVEGQPAVSKRFVKLSN